MKPPDVADADDVGRAEARRREVVDLHAAIGAADGDAFAVGKGRESSDASSASGKLNGRRSRGQRREQPAARIRVDGFAAGERRADREHALDHRLEPVQWLVRQRQGGGTASAIELDQRALFARLGAISLAGDAPGPDDRQRGEHQHRRRCDAHRGAMPAHEVR